MSITVDFTIKRYKTAQSKSYIDVTCVARTQDSDSSSADPNIFMLQKLPKNALGESTSRFSHIADPVDMEDYPAQDNQDSVYFRANEITLRVRSQFQVDHIVSVMRKQVQALVDALSAVPASETSFSQTFVG